MKLFKIGLFVGALLAMGAGCAASEYDVAQMEAEQAAANPPPDRLGCTREEWRAVSSALESARQTVANLADLANQRCTERFQREWFRCLCDPRGFYGGPVPSGCVSPGYSECEARSANLPNCNADLGELASRACYAEFVALNQYAYCAQKAGWTHHTIPTPLGPYTCSEQIPIE